MCEIDIICIRVSLKLIISYSSHSLDSQLNVVYQINDQLNGKLMALSLASVNSEYM